MIRTLTIAIALSSLLLSTGCFHQKRTPTGTCENYAPLFCAGNRDKVCGTDRHGCKFCRCEHRYYEED